MRLCESVSVGVAGWQWLVDRLGARPPWAGKQEAPLLSRLQRLLSKVCQMIEILEMAALGATTLHSLEVSIHMPAQWQDAALSIKAPDVQQKRLARYIDVPFWT